MISSPAGCFFPKTQAALAILPARGGNLARRNQIQPGLFLYPSRTSPRALCSVRLTRDARSPRAGGLHAKGANRAACMGEGEAFSGPLPSSSLGFRKAAHEFRAHDSNADQSLTPGGMAGAEGRVLRNAPPRPSIVTARIRRGASVSSCHGPRPRSSATATAAPMTAPAICPGLTGRRRTFSPT